MDTIAIIGAGQMGAGIAQVAAQSGYRVQLSDRDYHIAAAGKASIEKRWDAAVKKGKADAEDIALALARIDAVAGYVAFTDAFLVIEAATEREEVKRAIFAEVGSTLNDNAILATNTSSIPITRLAQAAPNPGRFMGLHFFNPVPVMRPVELIRGLATSDETVTRVEAFAKTLGKQTVHVNDAPGFVVNRILLPMLNEAIFALGEGVANVRDIDTAVSLGLNHPMGPLTLADFIGLDTCLEICRVLYSGTGDPKFRPAPLLVKYVEAGWLGHKTKRGFYDYSGPEPVPTR
jgi:3-hydroxybutyryl-CoA dehydrogenase